MGKKNKRLHAQTITLFLITMLAALLSLTSCDFLGDVTDPSADEPVKEWLERYTETAAIERHTVQGYTTTDNNGATCIPSDSDKTVTLYLRNPRGYTLNMSYILADGTKAEPESISLEQDADDPSIVRITYSKDFLLAHEGGGNIGGTVTIQDTGTQRYFEDYAINLTCNTAPPGVQNATVQLSGEEYVLCFFLPTEKLNSETHAKDEHVLHIQDASGNHKTAIVSAGFEQELISATPPADLESIYENGAVFDGAAQSGYTAYYWHTGITTTQTSSVRYSVWLTDRGGLSSSIAQTYGSLMGLARPKVFAGEDELDTYWIRKVTADDETGTATLTIKQTTTTWGTEVTGVTLSYTATDEEGNTNSGTDTDTATLTLKASKTYSITVKATKPLYASCTINFKVQVLPSEKIYVSESGSDEAGNGSKESPFKTIEKAVKALSAMDNDYKREAFIYVSGTIHGFTTLNTPSSKAASLNIQATPGAGTAVLDGEGKTCLLNIITAVPVTIEGITIQNGNSGTGGGITVGKNASVTLGSGTIVKGNTASGKGGAVYVKRGSTFAIEGSANIPYGDGLGKNDVFLESGATINVDVALSSEGTVATITLPAYTEGTTVLLGEAVSTEYKKFAVSNANWTIANNGKLAKAGTIKASTYSGTNEQILKSLIAAIKNGTGNIKVVIDGTLAISMKNNNLKAISNAIKDTKADSVDLDLSACTSQVIIAESTFEDCKKLTAITLPNTLTYIGAEAFKNTGLTSITFPTLLYRIGKEAFDDVPLTSATFNTSSNLTWKVGESYNQTNNTTVNISNPETNALNLTDKYDDYEWWCFP